jgi:ADP-ribose pyrophosphatase
VNESNRKTTLGAGRFLQLVSVNGWEYTERVNSTGVVVVAAVTDQDELVLTEQFRPPVHRRVIDLVAGLAGDVKGAETEALATAARRELLEEAGFEADRMIELARGPSSAGLTSEIVTFFEATSLTRKNSGGGDESEDIVVHLVPLHSITDWLNRRQTEGCYIDPKIYLALYFCEKRRPPSRVSV